MGFSLSSIGSSISNAVSDAYSGVKENVTAKNLAYVSPYNALLSSSGRENLKSVYGPVAGAVSSVFAGGGAAGLAGAAGNILGNNPDTPAWLANILGAGQNQAQKETPAATGGIQPIFLGGGAQSNMPAWIVPAAIAAGVLVLVLALKK